MTDRDIDVDLPVTPGQRVVLEHLKQHAPATALEVGEVEESRTSGTTTWKIGYSTALHRLYRLERKGRVRRQPDTKPIVWELAGG